MGAVQIDILRREQLCCRLLIQSMDVDCLHFVVRFSFLFLSIFRGYFISADTNKSSPLGSVKRTIDANVNKTRVY